MQSKCKSCDAPILWLLTEAKRRPIPINPDPIMGGNIEVIGGALARIVPAAQRTRELYVAHHATCADGAAWRKRHANGDEP